MATRQSIASRASVRTPAPLLAESERHLLRTFRRLTETERLQLLLQLRALSSETTARPSSR
jgi:AraC-like DNA-binding protein